MAEKQVLIKEETMQDIANSIREKSGTAVKMKPAEMPKTIREMEVVDTGVGSRQWWLDCFNGRTTYQNAFFRFTGETIPQIDTSNSSDFSSAYGYSKIKYLPELDYSNGEKFHSMCVYCTFLQTIKGFINLQNATNVTAMFSSCNALIEIRFVSKTIHLSISFAQSPLLSAESIQSIIDGLADLTGQTAQKLTLHPNVISKLTNIQYEQIKSKNWNVG